MRRNCRPLPLASKPHSRRATTTNTKNNMKHETYQVLSRGEQEKAMKSQATNSTGNSNSASAWDVLRVVVAEADAVLSTLAFGQLPGFLTSPQVRKIKFHIC